MRNLLEQNREQKNDLHRNDEQQGTIQINRQEKQGDKTKI